MGGYLLGFDCGTYEAKGTICDTSGNVKATAAVKYLLRVPQPGFAEHAPIEDWWNSFKTIVAELLQKSGVAASDIEGIGISAIMAAVTAVDDAGNPLRNAILYGIDTRSVKQAEELNAAIGEDKIRELGGLPCSVESYGPKIKWIADNEPEIFEKTRHITFAPGFLNFKLTGNYATDRYSVRSAQPMIDVRRFEWNDEMCSYVCPREWLPEVKRTVDVIGTVTAAAAAETGLAAGTPVIAGTTDAGAEAVSVGVVEPGDMMLMYGSTVFMIRLVEASNTDTRLWAGEYVLDNVNCVTGGMATTGSLTRWIRDNFAKELVEKEQQGLINSYDELFKEAEGLPVGSDGLVVLPYFMGERMPIMDPKAKGVFFGMNLRHTRGHIVKAALEGIGYGIDQLWAGLREAGIPINEVTSVGGGTKTPLWIQIVSDITGAKQVVPEVTVGASYGSALLAGLGIGALGSPADIKRIIKTKYVTEPNMENHKLYEPFKKYYAELYERNKDIMHAL